ncbi:MAG: hypothetical protein QNJ73_03810 [Gammaproteobacteria bacterium]|nr:hypothetical protein [Gammaproteobacteria bacterium]
MTRESTATPFEKGDVFLGCTLLNVPEDDHAGEGRIWQYDKDLNFKGELWTKGGHHFVGGLEFDNNGVLWAFNDLCVLHIDPKTARQLPLSDKFLPRSYRSASFDKAGNVYLGEHMKAEKKPDNEFAKRTTIVFPVIPDEGILGFGYIYKYDADWNLLNIFKTETAPDLTGFKGVTHSSLHPSEKFITYATETGKRLMRYDVVNDQQMPDLVTYPGDDITDRVWVIAVKYMPDGRLLITRGDFMELLDEDGEVLKSYPLETYGWSDIEVCGDGEHCLVSSIWTGEVVKVHVDSGEIVGRIDTGFAAPNRCLAGIAEYKD